MEVISTDNERAARTLIVSNRLPVQARVVNKKLALQRSSGGLVRGLEGVHDDGRSLWIGCLGESASSTAKLSPKDAAQLQREGFRIVEVGAKLYDAYYEGFSNGAIWPLLHYMPQRCHFSAARWEAYKKVNRLFADVILAELEPGDRVWIHDYQLMLLPDMLRRARQDLSIGFFLHVPFPSAEIFRVLPWRREILVGLLGADLIGFHTLEYMRHFSNAVARVLGLEPHMDTLVYGHREVRLGAFPLGIDVQGMHDEARTPESEAHIAELRDLYRNRKMLLGVDRLDYTKGIPERLVAYRAFLETYPEWLGKVSLVQVSVPSRVKVAEYKEIKREVDELVGTINGSFGRPGYTPIHYVVRNLDKPYLLALYRAADAMLVTPIRDGLNLVCKEYVACKGKGEEPGALVLSEFAGSAAEMGEAILVNPWSLDSMVSGIAEALTMPEETKLAMMSSLYERLARSDNRAWSARFLAALEDITRRNQREGYATFSEPDVEKLLARAAKAHRVFLFIDYDGTLVGIADKPELAVPTPDIVSLLTNMASIPNFRVHVVSGRDRYFLEQHLPGDITIVAEHGACIRRAGEKECVHLVDESAFRALRGNVRTIMADFERRIPGSTIEEKEFGIVWHYRMADAIFAHQQALVLADTLGGLLQQTPLGVLISKKAVEVRHQGVNKGEAVRAILEVDEFSPKHDLLLTMGDDRTDEDMFRVHPDHNISISVGDGPAVGAHVVEQERLVEILEILTRNARGWQYRLWETA